MDEPSGLASKGLVCETTMKVLNYLSPAVFPSVGGASSLFTHGGGGHLRSDGPGQAHISPLAVTETADDQVCAFHAEPPLLTG